MRIKSKFNEKDFRRGVLKLARTLGWCYAYSKIGLGFTTGFPDLILVHPVQKRVVFAELKVNARLTPEQEHWLQVLREAGCEAYVWTWSVGFNPLFVAV